MRTIQELRQLIGAVENVEKACSSFSLFSAGFPRASVIEIFGAGKTELLVLVEGTDEPKDRPHCVGTAHRAVHQRALQRESRTGIGFGLGFCQPLLR